MFDKLYLMYLFTLALQYFSIINNYNIHIFFLEMITALTSSCLLDFLYMHVSQLGKPKSTIKSYNFILVLFYF